MLQQTKILPSKIIGIQFSILSSDEIIKNSVAEITNRDTYINNKPVIGGLFDPRMGVLEAGLVCPTDGLDYMQTPGYFGHISLAKPVFYIQYLNTVSKVLRCVCFKCSKLLISKEKYKQTISSLHNEAKWNKVFQLASGVSRCGEDTEDGCGCKQPKITKEGLSSLMAVWLSSDGNNADEPEKMIVKLTPELVLKILRRISDEDVSFMGFSPAFSRPDWMICQTFAVPPPSVRPSVKHDAQQRSEDDITHIIVNIIKANNTLKEKLEQNAPQNVIDDWATVLQYYIATLVDNKIPGVASVSQRSGRPLKSIKERLNGKGGRVRGNLMGKRVDYSARSVITPDPNLSIRELGVPLKIAKNITKPVFVNQKNKNFLLKLVKNGPDVYPGAKILEKKNGDNISLRYVDRDSIVLEDGDTVHRHMMDGDGVLFNRQPTLHRMSMMCHIAKVMSKADTFRMNVADTKPYNADFDGDEMNLHMPQDVESEMELTNLAAVPYQIISPGSNSSIVGIFQDSLLGSYRFTRENINFTPRNAMNLLMYFDKVNPSSLNKSSVSSFDILSQIMPPLSLKIPNKQFIGSGESFHNSNNVVEVQNGQFIRGQLDKGALGGTSTGFLQRICNDFGNMESSNFIDNLQNIINEFMTQSGYSVGISDLIADNKTKETISEVIYEKKKDVNDLINQTHIGVFESMTGRSNEEEFEFQVNNILGDAAAQAGKLGRKSLSKENRFVIMVNAGSKGSELNISQMISCLGQQTVEGKRIPYGFDNRTLPHFYKYDDSPVARGFVESSFIGGLTPEEVFFHAMGGRTGLIDTAVKTSQTGYIQRRLIKGMEDLKVEYDMTVRNNKGKIVQFHYGDDGFETTKVEKQKVKLVYMSLDEIYGYFSFPVSGKAEKIVVNAFTKSTGTRIKKQVEKMNKKIQETLKFMIEQRHTIMEDVFKMKNNDDVFIPVAFSFVIQNIMGQHNIQSNSLSDITPLEAYELIDNTYESLEQLYYLKPNLLFKTLYYYHLNPCHLLCNFRFNRKSLLILLENIVYLYKKAFVAPGEMVGMIAAQSIGEPTTQMTLNTFHFAGVASKSNVTRGVPRVEEILSLSENPKQPSLTIYLHKEDEIERQKAQTIMKMVELTVLREVVKNVQICFDPDDLNTMIKEDESFIRQYKEFEALMDECGSNENDGNTEKSKWVIRMEIDEEILLEKNITMEDVHFALKNSYKEELSCIYTDYNTDKLIFRIRLHKVIQNKKKFQKETVLDQSDEIYMLKNFQDTLLNNISLRGVKNINKVVLRKDPNTVVYKDGNFVKQDIWVLDTVGNNLADVLALDYIDSTRTTSNNIQEMKNVLGIEAARQSIYNEFEEVLSDGSYINEHHLQLLCDRMTYSAKMISIFRHGINGDDIGPIAKASFEETPEMFLKAAKHSECDQMRGVSANIMCGQLGYFGTGAFQTYLDINEIRNLSQEVSIPDKDETNLEILMSEVKNPNDPCSSQKTEIQNNAIHIKKEDLGKNDFVIDF
jgi:DNA-directed RNA polymerase II subunit RPB1